MGKKRTSFYTDKINWDDIKIGSILQYQTIKGNPVNLKVIGKKVHDNSNIHSVKCVREHGGNYTVDISYSPFLDKADQCEVEIIREGRNNEKPMAVKNVYKIKLAGINNLAKIANKLKKLVISNK